MNSNLISDKDYKSYLEEIEKLIEHDPVEGSDDAERLKLLSIAVENYEKGHFFFNRPTPVEAIKFRMDEMGLNQNDISPYLGGKNRASEILSEKRNLTLPMIKALNKYLKIPLEILLRNEDESELVFRPDQLDFNKDIANELIKKGWIPQISESFLDIRRIIDNFLKPIGGLCPANVLCRQSAHTNVRNKTNKPALFLWAAKVLIDAETIDAPSFNQDALAPDFLREVARLSVFEQGPLLAQELLKRNGIKLVIVPHLSSTCLDGGVVIDSHGSPVIGLTLRYDRLDNFWHTLLHELAHIFKHMKIVSGPFLDDSDCFDDSDPMEKEADQIARDAAISRAAWKSSDILQSRTKSAVIRFAENQHVHPSIVAGRVRFETKDFKLFSDLLGSGTVRKIFGDVK